MKESEIIGDLSHLNGNLKTVLLTMQPCETGKDVTLKEMSNQQRAATTPAAGQAEAERILGTVRVEFWEGSWRVLIWTETDEAMEREPTHIIKLTQGNLMNDSAPDDLTLYAVIAFNQRDQTVTILDHNILGTAAASAAVDRHRAAQLPAFHLKQQSNIEHQAEIAENCLACQQAVRAIVEKSATAV